MNRRALIFPKRAVYYRWYVWPVTKNLHFDILWASFVPADFLLVSKRSNWLKRYCLLGTDYYGSPIEGLSQKVEEEGYVRAHPLITLIIITTCRKALLTPTISHCDLRRRTSQRSTKRCMMLSCTALRALVNSPSSQLNLRYEAHP